MLHSPWICMLCQQTSLKRWFANVNMTSYCDVTSSVYPVKMTTIRHCSILEFWRGASNQAVTPGITRPLHATGSEVGDSKQRQKISRRYWLVLQLTASPWTTEASTRERWQFGANGKAASSNRAPSLSSLSALSLYRDKRITIIRLNMMSSDNSLVVAITVTYYSWAPSSGDHLFTCGAIFWPPHWAPGVRG